MARWKATFKETKGTRIIRDTVVFETDKQMEFWRDKQVPKFQGVSDVVIVEIPLCDTEDIARKIVSALTEDELRDLVRIVGEEGSDFSFVLQCVKPRCA